MNETNLFKTSRLISRSNWSGHRVRLGAWRKVLEKEYTNLIGDIRTLEDIGVDPHLTNDWLETHTRTLLALEELEELTTKIHGIAVAIEVIEKNKEVLKYV